MTANTPVGPDPIVQTALQLLPVPDHGPGFWAELEARLDLETPATSQLEPALAVGPRLVARAAPVGPRGRQREPRASSALRAPTTKVVPGALRRRSNLLLATVAVIASVVVLFAGATLIRERSLTDLDTTKAGVSTERSTTTTTKGDGSTDAPERAVLTWVSALHAGDMAAAWAALGPASQAHFGSRSAFDQERSALAEGHGAWAQVRPDRVIVTPVPSGGEAVLVVVTFVGTLRQEGENVRRADAFPVRLDGGTAVVEPFAFAGEVELAVPGAPRGEELPLVQADDELVAIVPRGVDAPMLRIDGGEPVVCGDDANTALAEPADAPGQRCSYSPPGGLTPGRRVLTVAFASPDGSMVSARSVLFEVV